MIELCEWILIVFISIFCMTEYILPSPLICNDKVPFVCLFLSSTLSLILSLSISFCLSLPSPFSLFLSFSLFVITPTLPLQHLSLSLSLKKKNWIWSMNFYEMSICLIIDLCHILCYFNLICNCIIYNLVKWIAIQPMAAMIFLIKTISIYLSIYRQTYNNCKTLVWFVLSSMCIVIVKLMYLCNKAMETEFLCITIDQ